MWGDKGLSVGEGHVGWGRWGEGMGSPEELEVSFGWRSPAGKRFLSQEDDHCGAQTPASGY